MHIHIYTPSYIDTHIYTYIQEHTCITPKATSFTHICITYYCEVSFCLRKKIVANTLDVRMPKNKAQYEGFKYHNNQRRKELEWNKLETSFKSVKK